MPTRAQRVCRMWIAVTVLSVAMRAAPLAATASDADCPCLRNRGDAVSGDCRCDVGGCYVRCVEELCPSFPQCMLECSRRCYCAANVALGCADHVDPGATPTPAAVCPGDCNGDGRVSVDELVRSVNAVLGGLPTSVCPTLDWNGDHAVTIHEVIKAVNTALYGCVRLTADG